MVERPRARTAPYSRQSVTGTTEWRWWDPSISTYTPVRTHGSTAIFESESKQIEGVKKGQCLDHLLVHYRFNNAGINVEISQYRLNPLLDPLPPGSAPSPPNPLPFPLSPPSPLPLALPPPLPRPRPLSRLTNGLRYRSPHFC